MSWSSRYSRARRRVASEPLRRATLRSGRRVAAAGVAALCLALSASPSSAQPFSHTLTLVSPNPVPFTEFGAALAFLGNDVLVAQHDFCRPFTGEYEQGFVYLFESRTGALIRTFHDPDPPPGPGCTAHGFGASVAATGDAVFVYGDREIHQYVGSTGAFVGSYATGMQRGFGRAIEARGSRLLIGQPNGQLVLNWYAGTGYVYDYTIGANLLSIPRDLDVVRNYGDTVAFVGPNVLLGATHQGDAVGAFPQCVSRLYDGTTGAALFTIPGNIIGTYGGNILSACKITNALIRLYDGQSGSLIRSFPYSNPYHVTAFEGHVVASQYGKVSMMDVSTGSLVQELSSPSPQVGEGFGKGLAVRDSRSIVVGAPDRDHSGQPGAGSVYVYAAPAPLPALSLGGMACLVLAVLLSGTRRMIGTGTQTRP